MEVGEVPKGIRWSAKAGGPPKVRIGGVSSRGRGPIDPTCETQRKYNFLKKGKIIISIKKKSKIFLDLR